MKNIATCFLFAFLFITGCVKSEFDLPSEDLIDDKRIGGNYYAEDEDGVRTDSIIEKVPNKIGFYKWIVDINKKEEYIVKLYRVGDILICSFVLQGNYVFSKVSISRTQIVCQPLNLEWFKKNRGALAETIDPNWDGFLTSKPEKLKLFFRLRGDDDDLFSKTRDLHRVGILNRSP